MVVRRNIFVCTVHIGHEPFWSKVQPNFLRTHLPHATLVASVDKEIGETASFDYKEALEGTHRDKLDELAKRVVDRMATSEDDLIIFLDGDAFPIRSLMPLITNVLQDSCLAAICREENEEDYPHPSFCVTTAGLWKQLGCTWQESPDPAEISELGGGQLRDLLRQRGLEWRRLRRSNAFNPHPLMFGLYEGVIYHHGAGFRKPITAADRRALRDCVPGAMYGSPESYESLCNLIADRNQTMSAIFKDLVQYVPEFHRVLERKC